MITPCEKLVFAFGAIIFPLAFFHRLPLFIPFSQIKGNAHYAATLLSLGTALFPITFMLAKTALVHLRSMISWKDSLGPYDLKQGLLKEKKAFLDGVRVVRDWFPLLLFLQIYWSSGFVVEMFHLSPKDGLLAKWDMSVFGAHYSVWAQKFYNPTLTAVMDFCYFVHTLIPPLFLCLAYLTGRRRIFERSLFFIILTDILGAIGHALVPAYGPYYYLHSLYTKNLTRSKFVTEFIDVSREYQDAFPSLHAAISGGLLYYQYKYDKWLFWLILPLALGIWTSTIYLRYHYTIDLPAGFLLAVIGIFFTESIFKSKERGVSLESM